MSRNIGAILDALTPEERTKFVDALRSMETRAVELEARELSMLRFQAACAAMQGMLSCSRDTQIADTAQGNEAQCAQWAVSHADALLAELAKPVTP